MHNGSRLVFELNGLHEMLHGYFLRKFRMGLFCRFLKCASIFHLSRPLMPQEQLFLVIDLNIPLEFIFNKLTGLIAIHLFPGSGIDSHANPVDMRDQLGIFKLSVLR